MAKQFSGRRPFEVIKAACLKNGWGWDQSRYDDGSDYVTFGFQCGSKRITVIYNSFNGRFIVKHGKKMVTEESTEMDGTRWYDELLDFIYIPTASKAA
jgi:hypothetical protein